MNCKELNITSCFFCKNVNIGDCLIQFDIYNINKKESFERMFSYYKVICSIQNESISYFEKALEISKPEWFTRLQQLIILQ